MYNIDITDEQIYTVCIEITIPQNTSKQHPSNAEDEVIAKSYHKS